MAFQIVVVLLTLLAAVTKTEPEPRYDPATVVDLMVVVTEVRAAAGENGLDGVRLIVRTEANTNIDVYLGPSSFLKEFEITFAKGDRIQIIGSKIKLAGSFIVLAREVRKDSTTLYLRGRNGEPYWHSGS
jgi:hypothetical protein